MKAFWRRWLPRRDWDEELESHLAMRSEWNQQQLGLSGEDGAQLAHRQFGSKLRIRESIEDLYPARLVADFLQDLRHALRLFRHSPGFAITAVGVTAAGIAAATTIFSVVDPLLFRSLPFRDDKQLVSVGIYGPIDTNEFAMGNMYVEWRDHQTVFSSLTAMRPETQCDLEFTQTERVPCVAVQQNFLSTLGVDPKLGRNFTRDEDLPNAPRTALISSRIWRVHFGGQPDVIGKVVRLDQARVRIIGVLPPGFLLPQGADPDVLLPAQIDERLLADPNATVFLRAFARLKRGVSIDDARKAMSPLFADSIRRTVPAGLRKEVRPVIRSVRDRIVQEAKLASQMLLGAVGLLLLMGCLSVTNLLIARAHAREGELAMRSTLGASRGRLIRQSLTETMLLSLAGGVIGYLLSCACVRLLVHSAPGGFLQLEKMQTSLRAFAFATIVTIMAAVLSGLVPALRRANNAIVRSWRVTNAGTARLRQTFLSLQLACSLILLTGALMFGRSLSQLESQQPGFTDSGLTTASLRLSRVRYRSRGSLPRVYREIENSLRALPGVQQIAISDSIPPAGSMHGRPLSNILVAGRPPLQGEGGMVGFRYVTPDYFRVMGIPLLRGRVFTEAERRHPGATLVISDTLARRLFPSADPLGQRVSLNDGMQWLTIAGIVRDVKNDGINLPAAPEYYKLRTDDEDALGLSAVVLVRSGLDTATLSRWITQAIQAVDPTVSIVIESMPERMYRLNDRARFLVLVLAIFAVVSIVLSASGLYGVVAFLVSGRTKELGIRAALGATRRNLVMMVERQMFWCIATGVAAGLIGSLALAGVIRGLLYQVSPHDPAILVAAALLLLAVALLAAFRPSWKAARIDPAQALRVD